MLDRDNRVVGRFGAVASDGSGTVAGGPARGGGLYVGGLLIATGATLQADTAEGGQGRDAATTGGREPPVVSQKVGALTSWGASR